MSPDTVVLLNARPPKSPADSRWMRDQAMAWRLCRAVPSATAHSIADESRSHNAKISALAYAHPTTSSSRPPPEAGWSAAQSASGASTFLHRLEGLPSFPPQPRPEGPTSLSTTNGATMRLCRADSPASRFHAPETQGDHHPKDFGTGTERGSCAGQREAAPTHPAAARPATQPVEKAA